MPLPAKVTPRNGSFRLTSNFRAYISGDRETRATEALSRFLFRLDHQAMVMFAKNTDEVKGRVKGILTVKPGKKSGLEVGVDESYILDISPDVILLESNTDIGTLRGLETLFQLLSYNAEGWYFPCGRIEDAPRFPWRGLLIDVCRHFQPVDIIKRNLDGMAAVKMNVLHLHLSEDQGFRIESRSFPKLHQMGSNGQYFTQAQIKDIIRYADARGIRVIPEFDIPGHATSWFVGYPNLASAPGPYEIEKGFGVFDPTMDPTRESTYEFLEIFLREMCALFPDPYFHIGGDENNGKQWDANPEIQKWMKDHDIKDNHGLQAYFNQRVSKLLTSNGKKMVGWDEILQPELPDNIIIQSWRGKEALVEAAKKGYDVLLSNGYYIDLCKPASHHYLNDPLPADAGLSEMESKHVLGGEATMWAELVTPETVDSRIWPRTAAIAERFWSPGSFRDVHDMYRRLALQSDRLEAFGLMHQRYQPGMLRRLSGPEPWQNLEPLVHAMEPLKVYSRHHQGVKYSTDLPFTRLPDACFVESPTRLRIQEIVHRIETGNAIPDVNELVAELDDIFESWNQVQPLLERLSYIFPAWKSVPELGKAFSEGADIGKRICEIWKRGAKPEPAWATEAKATLEKSKGPYMEAEIAAFDALIDLIEILGK